MALDKLANIDKEEPQVALALLEFVSRAQENWPWATPHLKNHPQFFTSIVNDVSKLKISSLPVTDQIFVTRVAAVVADISAVYLHSAKESRDWSFVKTLIPLVQWYAKDAVDVSAYNYSLHANLKKNFESRTLAARCLTLSGPHSPVVAWEVITITTLAWVKSCCLSTLPGLEEVETRVSLKSLRVRTLTYRWLKHK